MGFGLSTDDILNFEAPTGRPKDDDSLTKGVRDPKMCIHHFWTAPKAFGREKIAKIFIENIFEKFSKIFLAKYFLEKRYKISF